MLPILSEIVPSPLKFTIPVLLANVSIEPKIPIPSDIFTVAFFPAKLISPVKPVNKFAVPVFENTISVVVVPPVVLKFAVPEPIVVVVATILSSKFTIPFPTVISVA